MRLHALAVLVVLALTGCPKRADAPDSGGQSEAPAQRTDEVGLPAPAKEDPGGGVPEAAPPPSTDTGSDTARALGEACASDSECPRGSVCEGCSDDDRICVQGCRKNADCAGGEVCQTVQCMRCPCPRLCGTP